MRRRWKGGALAGSPLRPCGVGAACHRADPVEILEGQARSRVPGLILLTIWSVGAPAIVVERIGPVDAFGRSRQLVRGEGWSVFATLLVVLLIVIGVGIVLGVIATPIGDGEAATYVASIVSSAITAPIFALAASIMYFDLGGGVNAGPQQPPAAQPSDA